MGRRATKKVTINGEITQHQRYLYRGYLQIACVDLTRTEHPCLRLITWDPVQPVATRPLAIQKDGTWYTYGWDLTKNICEVYGPAGYIRTTYTYTPFGTVTAEGDVTQPIQWSSEYADEELGLVYYNYRHYSARDGRWIGRDNLPKNNTPHPYSYIDNQSIYNIDLIGLKKYAGIIDVRDTTNFTHLDGCTFSTSVDSRYKILNYEEKQIELECPKCKCLLIWVHGFKNSRKTAIDGFTKVQDRYEGACDVYGFSWESDHLNFGLAIETARQVGKINLANFFRAVKAKCPDTTIHIATHSLGARVALTAIKSAYDVSNIGNIILTNPAIDYKSFEKGKEFENVASFANSITIVHSKEDSVLDSLYPLGTWFGTPMGLKGPSNPKSLPKNVHIEDYTKDFGSEHSAVTELSKERTKRFWSMIKKLTSNNQ